MSQFFSYSFLSICLNRDQPGMLNFLSSFHIFQWKFYQSYSSDLILQCSVIRSKWRSVILLSKDLSESREQDISNRSEASESKDAKATFVKGVISHIAELCPGRCDWSTAAPGSLLLLSNKHHTLYF